MILTGEEIRYQREQGVIVIDPFDPEAVNPNSYNFRLGPILRVYTGDVLDPHQPNPTTSMQIPEDGLVLQPRRLYLAHTIETLGSTHYAPTFAARSSVARLGLFINLSACLGDIGYIGQWTLQLYALNPIKVYAGMAIGQMMWWQPTGEVQLYSGKYQGAHGPRPSAIHVDYLRHPPANTDGLPSLESPAKEELVGGKFAALAHLHPAFPIPDAFTIPATEFRTALGPERVHQLQDVFEDLRATVGAHVSEACEDIQRVVADVRVRPDLAARVGLRLLDLGTGSFAVRSSAIGEDGAQDSYAGVHDSFLRVAVDDVTAAVAACWRSYYSSPAVLTRLRNGDTSPEPRFAVVVQRMVEPVLAGIAFTRPPDEADSGAVDIEYITGSGEHLVAGIAESTRVTIGPDDDATETADMTAVAGLARRAHDAVGAPVDIEWAIDEHGSLWLLQCRPVTAPLDVAPCSSRPYLRTVALYPGSDEAGPADHLYYGPVAGIVAATRSKRDSAFAQARGLGAETLPGWVVNLNGHALSDPILVDQLGQVVSTGPADTVVLDLGEGLRQQILAMPDLVPNLESLLFNSPRRDRIRSLVLREYLRGDRGVIATTRNDRLIIESSVEGLLAMNRGTAASDQLIVDPGSKGIGQAADWITPAHQRTIEQVTAALTASHNAATTEWVLHAGRLYFIDYSIATGPGVGPTADRRIISPGRCAGPILTLATPDDQLARVSLGAAISVNDSTGDGHRWAANLIAQANVCPRPPIIVARRPYAALSVLIGHVAGFVFEAGPALCHLGILLREAKVPAIVEAHPPTGGHASLSELGVSSTDG